MSILVHLQFQAFGPLTITTFAALNHICRSLPECIKKKGKDKGKKSHINQKRTWSINNYKVTCTYSTCLLLFGLSWFNSSTLSVSCEAYILPSHGVVCCSTSAKGRVLPRGFTWSAEWEVVLLASVIAWFSGWSLFSLSLAYTSDMAILFKCKPIPRGMGFDITGFPQFWVELCNSKG